MFIVDIIHETGQLVSSQFSFEGADEDGGEFGSIQSLVPIKLSLTNFILCGKIRNWSIFVVSGRWHLQTIFCDYIKPRLHSPDFQLFCAIPVS
jgi:hypothetical protein